MQEKSLIKKNILQFIENKGVSKYKFYQDTGITRGILDQNNGMSEENTAKFLAQYPEVNPEWLLTGKGEMLKDPEIAVSSSQPQENDKYISSLEKQISLLEKNNALLEKENIYQAKEIQRLEKEVSVLKKQTKSPTPAKVL